MFDNENDITQKLGNTVILVDGLPVYVRKGITKDGKLGMLVDLLPRTEDKKDSNKFVALDYHGLDYRTINSRLGYCNVFEKKSTQAVYLMRMAARKPHQGICSDNMSWPHLKENAKLGIHKAPLAWSSLVNNQSFVDMILERYPKLSKIGQMFAKRDTVQSVAFHRFFAVNRKAVGPFFLEYKGKDIAWAEDVSSFILCKDYAYLQETLEYNDIAIKRVA
jgi:hypothetical protein